MLEASEGAVGHSNSLQRYPPLRSVGVSCAEFSVELHPPLSSFVFRAVVDDILLVYLNSQLPHNLLCSECSDVT